ncbi:hypothetical protein B0H17DRAFT_1153806 [Mycena rosella]|uniref:Uncharacterized protein n=1 Tax=Mycena rosella TaxID=1033263 RepID=A0AAD7B288_MYCRO|nr:hypothetical protein B0H17DRAFT_1153806 [Mycena rosella]
MAAMLALMRLRGRLRLLLPKSSSQTRPEPFLIKHAISPEEGINTQVGPTKSEMPVDAYKNCYTHEDPRKFYLGLKLYEAEEAEHRLRSNPVGRTASSSLLRPRHTSCQTAACRPLSGSIPLCLNPANGQLSRVGLNYSTFRDMNTSLLCCPEEPNTFFSLSPALDIERHKMYRKGGRRCRVLPSTRKGWPDPVEAARSQPKVDDERCLRSTCRSVAGSAKLIVHLTPAKNPISSWRSRPPVTTFDDRPISADQIR